MFSIGRSVFQFNFKNCSKFVSSAFISRNSTCLADQKIRLKTEASVPVNLCCEFSSHKFLKENLYSPLEINRYFSKKKGSKRTVQEESDSDTDEEQYEENVDEDELGTNVITRTVTSMRLDSVIKAGLSLTKKKIEQEFYNFKLRVNGIQPTKKAMNVYVGDELDHVKGFSPDTSKYLVVDRIIIKGIDKATGTGLFPVKMEILKGLIIGNYDDPWKPSSEEDLDK